MQEKMVKNLFNVYTPFGAFCVYTDSNEIVAKGSFKTYTPPPFNSWLSYFEQIKEAALPLHFEIPRLIVLPLRPPPYASLPPHFEIPLFASLNYNNHNNFHKILKVIPNLLFLAALNCNNRSCDRFIATFLKFIHYSIKFIISKDCKSAFYKSICSLFILYFTVILGYLKKEISAIMRSFVGETYYCKEKYSLFNNRFFLFQR